jgi:Phage tail tube protein
MTTFGIGGGGAVGIAIEPPSGGYTVPTKWFPVLSSNLMQQQATVYRRGIRQTVDAFGALPGNEHIAGDLEVEFLHDTFPYFMAAARTEITKTDNTGSFTYDIDPSDDANSSRTLTIVEIKNDEIFAYTGCAVSAFTMAVSDGIPVCTFAIIGNTESEQSPPVPTFTTVAPTGAGQWQFQIDDVSTNTVDAFEFSVDDAGEPQFRLRNDTRGATWVKYGERNTTLVFDRDFDTRAEFDAYKALTEVDFKITASNFDVTPVTDERGFTIHLPRGVRSTYEIPLGGQGDVIRARQEVQALLDPADDRAYRITVDTSEDVVAIP